MLPNIAPLTGRVDGDFGTNKTTNKINKINKKNKKYEVYKICIDRTVGNIIASKRASIIIIRYIDL
jgi:hypothetical protein